MGKKFKIALVSLVVAEDVLLSSCTVSDNHDLRESLEASTAIETSLSSRPETCTPTTGIPSTQIPATNETTEEITETIQVTIAQPPEETTLPAATETTSPMITQAPTTEALTESTTQAATEAPTESATAASTETAAQTTTQPTTAPPGTVFDTTSYAWYNIRNNEHTLPGIPDNAGPWLSAYNGIFVGDTTGKVFYFTFDAGADTGYAGHIMDVLTNQGIKATFFVTKSYITNNPDVVRRMVIDGHTVANHTVSHADLSTLSDEQIRQELQSVEDEFYSVTGTHLTRCIRPPMGNYSERSLYVTSQLGYKTVFWSIAYKDYDVNNQPSYEEAMAIVQNNYHDGAIFLLHIASKTDADALNDMILFLKAQGYGFDVIG